MSSFLSVECQFDDVKFIKIGELFRRLAECHNEIAQSHRVGLVKHQPIDFRRMSKCVGNGSTELDFQVRF